MVRTIGSFIVTKTCHNMSGWLCMLRVEFARISTRTIRLWAFSMSVVGVAGSPSGPCANAGEHERTNTKRVNAQQCFMTMNPQLPIPNSQLPTPRHELGSWELGLGSSLEPRPEPDLHGARLIRDTVGRVRLPEPRVALVEHPGREVRPVQQVEHLEHRLHRVAAVEVEALHRPQVHAVQVFLVEITDRNDRAVRAGP